MPARLLFLCMALSTIPKHRILFTRGLIEAPKKRRSAGVVVPGVILRLVVPWGVGTLDMGGIMPLRNLTSWWMFTLCLVYM